jgi:hypothetical protein
MRIKDTSPGNFLQEYEAVLQLGILPNPTSEPRPVSTEEDDAYSELL